MTTRRRSPSRSFARARAPRRQTVWDTTFTDPVAVTQGAVAFVRLSLGFRTDVRKGLTILRVIGQLHVASNSAGQSVEWNAGLTMVVENNVPSPAADLNEPWMWYKGGHTDSFAALDGVSHQSYDMDVKAKRRFREDDDQLLFVIANHDVAFTLAFNIAARVLYALP